MEAMRKASWSGVSHLVSGAARHVMQGVIRAGDECHNRGNYETDTIYELMVDRFYDGDPSNNNPYNQANSYDSTGTNINDYFGGDWQGVINKMQYLQDMGSRPSGLPAHMIIFVNRTSKPATAPITTATTAIGRETTLFRCPLGSWAVFDNMVTSAHQHGIKVIIDFVTNHSNQNDSSEQGGFYNNGTLMGTSASDTQGYFHHYGTRADTQTTRWDYNIETLQIWLTTHIQNGAIIGYFQNAIKVWLDHNIDGIRSDAVLHQDPAFLKIWQDYINAYKPVYDFGEFWISTPDSKYGDYKTFQARTGIGILDFELSNVMTGTFGTFSNTMNDLANTLAIRQATIHT